MFKDGVLNFYLHAKVLDYGLFELVKTVFKIFNWAVMLGFKDANLLQMILHKLFATLHLFFYMFLFFHQKRGESFEGVNFACEVRFFEFEVRTSFDERFVLEA